MKFDSFPYIHTILKSNLIKKRSENRFKYLIDIVHKLVLRPIVDPNHHDVIISHDDSIWEINETETDEILQMTLYNQRKVTKLCSLLTSPQNEIFFKKLYYFPLKWIRKINKQFVEKKELN